MSDRKPLMPKATAVWLVENTSLSFEQIAEFCGLHVLEVKGIADGDVAHGIKGMDPISSGQLSREEIARAEEDHDHKLELAPSKVNVPVVKTKAGPRYTPVSRRHDRPNAVLWLLRSHPELRDSQIMRLVGTTKPTIQSIRERTHWNSTNLTPQDPVTLGLCAQTALDAEVKKAAGEMAAWCDDFLKKSEADGRPLYTKAESEKLLAAIAAAATSKTWTADPEAAMHLTWAYLSLRDGMGLAPQAGAVDALGKTVPVRVRSMPYTMKLPDPKDPEKMIDGPVPAGAAIRPRLQLFAGFKAEDFTAKFAELLKK